VKYVGLWWNHKEKLEWAFFPSISRRKNICLWMFNYLQNFCTTLNWCSSIFCYSKTFLNILIFRAFESWKTTITEAFWPKEPKNFTKIRPPLKYCVKSTFQAKNNSQCCNSWCLLVFSIKKKIEKRKENTNNYVVSPVNNCKNIFRLYSATFRQILSFLGPPILFYKGHFLEACFELFFQHWQLHVGKAILANFQKGKCESFEGKTLDDRFLRLQY
jgi:hypothetical protein